MKSLIKASCKAVALSFFVLLANVADSKQLLAATDDKLSCEAIDKFNPEFLLSDDVIPDTKLHVLKLYYNGPEDVIEKLVVFTTYIIGGKIYLYQIADYNKSFPLNFIESLVPLMEHLA